MNWDGNGRSLEEVEGCTAEEYYSKKKGIVSDYSAKDGNGSQPEEEFGSSELHEKEENGDQVFPIVQMFNPRSNCGSFVEMSDS